MILPFLVLVNGVLGSYGIKKVKSGTDKIIEADKKLDKAYKRNTHNINRLNNETEKTNKSLEALGKKEYEIIDSFGEFIDVWETLQNKPEFKDIEKDTVEMAPNYDDTELEPTVLPCKFPNLLVNGATGISAGYATDIPPHNLGEIIDATVLRIEKPKCTLDEILEVEYE